MATLCFERAEDGYWERRSKASGLRAFAEHIHNANPVEANAILREAAVMFETIGKADSAAQCFFDIGEFERAGKYLIGSLTSFLIKSDLKKYNVAGRLLYCLFIVDDRIHCTMTFFLFPTYVLVVIVVRDVQVTKTS